MTRILCLFVIACAFVLGTSVAEARDFNCDASALRLTLGGQATVEPITANRGQAECKDVKSQTKQTIGPVTIGALIAETSVPNATQVDAQGGLGLLSVSAEALAGIPIPTLDQIDQIPPVVVPVSPLDQVLGLPPEITVDIRPAVKSIVAGLKTGPLLEVAGSLANAHARCDGSTPVLTGDTQTAGLKVLGQEIPTNAVVNQVLTLYNGQTIDPGALDLTQIPLPPAVSILTPTLQQIAQNLVKDFLAQMPDITLPEALINLSVKPSSQVKTDGGLTQQGLSVSLSLLGQNVVSLVAGEARVSVDSVKCTVSTPQGEVAPVSAVPEQALSCSTRRLALINVLDRGSYVAIYGAADKRLAGKRVSIRSKADGGKVVARPRVNRYGLFHAKAPLPPERYRHTNTARYKAVHGSDESLNLKLHRRMVFTSVKSAHGKVTLSGIVTKPWTKDREIVIRQRLTCRKQKVVARVHPDSRGRFKVTVKAPKNGDVGVYRATTMVAFPDPDAPDFRTYTLPGLVRFAR
ncbi:MAG TPA: hypothetical protein VF066_07770 [Thermoleophilaceae bacterium]